MSDCGVVTSFSLEVLLAAILDCGSGRYETEQARLLCTTWCILMTTLELSSGQNFISKEHLEISAAVKFSSQSGSCFVTNLTMRSMSTGAEAPIAKN